MQCSFFTELPNLHLIRARAPTQLLQHLRQRPNFPPPQPFHQRRKMHHRPPRRHPPARNQRSPSTKRAALPDEPHRRRHPFTSPPTSRILTPSKPFLPNPDPVHPLEYLHHRRRSALPLPRHPQNVQPQRQARLEQPHPDARRHLVRDPPRPQRDEDLAGVQRGASASAAAAGPDVPAARARSGRGVRARMWRVW